MMAMVVKSKIYELEDEVRAGISIRMRKELTGVVQGVSGRRRFLVRFQNGCENNLSLNQITVVIVENILEEKEPGVSDMDGIPEEQVNWRRDNITVSISCYVFKRRPMFTVRRSRRMWRIILMRRIWTMSI